MLVKTFSNRLPNRKYSFVQRHLQDVDDHSRHRNGDSTRGQGRGVLVGSIDDEATLDCNDVDEKKRKRRRRLWDRLLCFYGTYLQQRQLVPRLLLLIALSAAVVLFLLKWIGSSQTETKLTELPAIDFVVGGFPKCGTTTLLYALHRHAQIQFPSRESCALKDTWRQTYQVRRRYLNEVRELLPETTQRNLTRYNSVTDIKRSSRSRQSVGKVMSGIKCPTALYSYNFMQRLNEINLANYGSNAGTHPIKWVIGIRHPVWQVQSFYNYRITELYDKKSWWKDIRSLEDIMFSDVPWKDMSSLSHKYEHHMNLLLSFVDNTTSSSSSQIPSAIFLYTLEQIEDVDANRAMQFRHDLSSFLGLDKILSPLGKENVNRFVSGPDKHPEIISICDDKFQAIRRKLVMDSISTVNWIQHNLIREQWQPSGSTITAERTTAGTTANVIVSNSTFFNEVLETWKNDPCEKIFINYKNDNEQTDIF